VRNLQVIGEVSDGLAAVQNAVERVMMSRMLWRAGSLNDLVLSRSNSTHPTSTNSAPCLRREVGQTFEIRGRNRPFSTLIQFRQLIDLRVSYIWFAPAMVISLIPADPYYSLYFRHSGSSEYRVPGRAS
jgi:hypothetical protein